MPIVEDLSGNHPRGPGHTDATLEAPTGGWTLDQTLRAAAPLGPNTTWTGDINLAALDADALYIKIIIDISMATTYTINMYGSVDGGTTIDTTGLITEVTDNDDRVMVVTLSAPFVRVSVRHAGIPSDPDITSLEVKYAYRRRT